MKTEKLSFPDYKNSIVNVSCSVLRHFGVSCCHSGLPALDAFLSKNHRNIVYMVFDGLGSEALNRNLPSDSFLSSCKHADISSVYPSTTTAALTSIQTGLTPLEHGWLGWSCYFKEFDSSVDLFSGMRSSDAKQLTPHPASTLMPFGTLFDKIAGSSPDVTCSAVAGYLSHESLNADDICRRVEELCEQPGRHLIFTYHHEPDSSMHDYGPYSPQAQTQAAQIDAAVRRMSERVSDTLIVITADHGQIEVQKEIWLNDYPELCECLILPPFVESRAVSLFVKAGRRAFFEQRFCELFGSEFLLMTHDQVYEQELLGTGNIHAKISDFIGDFFAVAAGGSILRYRLTDGSKVYKNFAGHHAGLLKDEMTVPLIVIER